MPPTKQRAMKDKKPMSDQSTLWGSALEYWDSWGLWLMIAGGALGFFALAASLSSSFILWKVAGRAQTELQSKTSSLDAESAKSRLETEKLKAVVAWRTISTAQNIELEKVLSEGHGSVNLRWTDGDPEALFLAIQISQVLQKAKWQVAAGSFKPANRILFGLILPPDAGKDADTLRQAFSAAHLSFSSVPVPQDGASFNVSTIAGAPILMIGSRLPVVP
jgi:hypothetical protein